VPGGVLQRGKFKPREFFLSKVKSKKAKNLLNRVVSITRRGKAQLFAEAKPIQFFTAAKFREWLDSHVEFNGSTLLDVQVDPPLISIGFDTVPSYRANDLRKIRSFTIYPEGSDIDLTSLYVLFETGPAEILIDNIETAADDEKIALRLHFLGGADAVILADTYCIEENPPLRVRRLPWISETELYLEFPGELPRPEFWIRSLRERGHDVCFRYSWGDERTPEQIPYPDYSGWFLQMRNRLQDHSEGIFFFHVKKEEGVTRFHFDNRDPQLQKVWLDLCKIVATFPRVQVHSGNCEFSGKAWHTFLTTGALPKKLQPK